MNDVMRPANHRELRDRKVTRMGEIVAKAQAESRNLRADEAAEFDQLDREARQLERSAQAVQGYNARGVSRPASLEQSSDEMRAYGRFLRTGEQRTAAGWTTSQSTGSGDDAGFTVPQEFWENFQVALKAFGGVLSGAKTLETADGREMPWPTVDPTTFVGGIVGTELTQESPITPLTVGQGVLNAWTYTPGGPILISNQLVQDSAFDIVGFVQERTAEAIGRALAAHAVSGSGSGQPLGILTALAAKGAVGSGSGGYLGLGTATDVTTFGGTVTELAGQVLSPQSLINLVKSIDASYLPGAKWYMNSTIAWNMRGVVDSEGRPIINFENGFDADNVTGPNYSSNAPIGKIFGFPVVIDNSLPNLTASTVSGVVFGDLSKAMVYRSVRSMEQMVLKERYADQLATAVYTSYRADIRSNDVRAAIASKPAAT